MTHATGAAVECYAQRLLNPYRGVVQVIRYAAAEAVSTDGLNWGIYVSNSALLSGLEPERTGRPGRQIQISDIHYGSWSAAKGLKRGPLYPSEDFLHMEAMGAVVFEHLLRVHDQVPFALRDRLELWLLDRDSAPLALLDSAISRQDMEQSGAPHWHAGYTAEDRFVSRAMRQAPDALNAAQCLTRHVNQLAGPRPVAQWFMRHPDGAGVAEAGVLCDARSPYPAGHRLEAAAFPVKLLAEGGAGDPHHGLLVDYLDWLAPSLLLLWELGDRERARLEVVARLQADQVCRLHRLYPRVLDPALINAARVEAMLCDSRASRNGEQDQLPTYYIELSPGGAE